MTTPFTRASLRLLICSFYSFAGPACFGPEDVAELGIFDPKEHSGRSKPDAAVLDAVRDAAPEVVSRSISSASSLS